MNHILITGSTGYLGSALLAQLIASDAVGHITITSHSRPPGIAASPKVTVARYAELLDGSLPLQGVDIICHLAVPRVASNDPALAQSVADMRKLIVRARDAGVGGVIFASSQAVYGATPPIWDETSTLAPATAYGWSKLAHEELLRTSSALCPALRTISLRLPKMVGPGTGFRSDQGEWVHSLAEAALSSRTVIMRSQFLKTQFDFLDVRDAASILLRVLLMPADGWPAVLNVGTGVITTGEDLLNRVNDCVVHHYGKKLSVKLENQPGPLRNFGMAADGMQQYLGGFATMPLSTTIADVCQWILGES